MKTNLIFFLARFGLGGAGNSVYKLCRALNKNKYNINVICLNKCAYETNLKKLGIKVFTIKSKKVLFAISSVLKILYIIKSSVNKTVFISNINYTNILCSIFIKKEESTDVSSSAIHLHVQLRHRKRTLDIAERPAPGHPGPRRRLGHSLEPDAGRLPDVPNRGRGLPELPGVLRHAAPPLHLPGVRHEFPGAPVRRGVRHSAAGRAAERPVLGRRRRHRRRAVRGQPAPGRSPGLSAQNRASAAKVKPSPRRPSARAWCRSVSAMRTSPSVSPSVATGAASMGISAKNACTLEAKIAELGRNRPRATSACGGTV